MNFPFPLAIITDEVSQDLDRVLSFAHEFKLDGVEIRSLFGKAYKDFSDQDVKTIGRAMKAAGLKVAGCATPVFKCPLDDKRERSLHLDIFKRSLDQAHEWEASMVRVFTFFRKNNPSSTDDLKRAAEQFQELIHLSRGSGLKLGVENEYSTVVGDGVEAKAFLDLVTDPSVGMVWDPCNVLFQHAEGDPVEKFFPLIADRTLHFHVKDARREKGKTAEACIEVGKGEIDFSSQLAALKKTNFKGWVSLETHWRSVQLSKEDAHLPAGHAFSANAEPASRICMKNLQDFLEKL